MSSIKEHTLQAAATGAVLYPFIGMHAVPFGLAVVFVDLDHVVEYVRQTGSLKVWGVFPCCKIIEKNLNKGFLVFNLFHTVEFILLLGMLGIAHPAFYYVTAGVLWHYALDLFHLTKNGCTFRRAFSVVEYVIRAQNPETILSFTALLGRDDVVMPQDRWDYDAWRRHWQQRRPLC